MRDLRHPERGVADGVGGVLTMPKTIILKTKLTATAGAKVRPEPYSCRLNFEGYRGDGEVIFQVGQPFPDGSIQWMGGWYLKTLLEPAPGQRNRDVLVLDGGQNWVVNNMIAALEEALGHVKIGGKDNE